MPRLSDRIDRLIHFDISRRLSIGATTAWLLVSVAGGVIVMTAASAACIEMEWSLPAGLSQTTTYVVVIALFGIATT